MGGWGAGAGLRDNLFIQIKSDPGTAEWSPLLIRLVVTQMHILTIYIQQLNTRGRLFLVSWGMNATYIVPEESKTQGRILCKFTIRYIQFVTRIGTLVLFRPN